MAEPTKRETLSGGVPIFRLAGIRVTIHYSWLLIFLLVVWSLSAGYLPRTFPGQSPGAYWAAGLAATLLFFASVLIHEFCHAFVAAAAGIPVPNITLFVFGGVSQISEEAQDPLTEFKVAAAGPLGSFGLAFLLWGVGTWAGLGRGSLTGAVVGYLAWVNLALGAFNLIPGFPLDGGRVLRAVVWWKTGSLARATRVASDVGKGFAIALMVLGAVQIFQGGLIGGLWLIFIGIFLRSVAEGSYQQTVIRQSLEGARVRDVMVENVVSVPPTLTVERLVLDYFLHYGYRGYPVLDGGKPVGVVSVSNVKHLSHDEHESVTVQQVMAGVTEDLRIAPATSLADALKRLTQGKELLLVMEEDRLSGLITKTGLLRFVELKEILHH